MKPITQLFKHQQTAVEKLLPIRVGALFMEMGTGKSRTAIEIVSRRTGKIKNVIWFCPVSLKQTIRNEIAIHTDCADSDIYVFDDKTDEHLVPEAFWYIVGIESMSSSPRVIFTVNELVKTNSMVIVDESSYIKGHKADRTQRITHICERASYRLILTGTPISQGVVDLYAQMRFLSPDILGYKSFYSFARNHLEYSDRYPGMIVRSHNIGYIAAKIKPYVYQVTKKECITLPDKLYDSRYLYMTYEQEDAYAQAKEELLYSVLEEEFNSITIFRLFTALQQIVCGFWNHKRKDKTVEHLEFKHNRINILLDTVRSIPDGEKIIIWSKFHHDITQISKALIDEFGSGSVSFFHGKLNETERGKELDKFRKNARFFLSTYSCGGHGLTLNESHYVIFYNNVFKYSDRLQAEDRCHRIGQDKKVTYIDIRCSNSIDSRIANALDRKENIVESFKKQIEKVKNDRTKIKDIVKSL